MTPLRPTDPTYVGPYRLVARLGSGGMGLVYLGISPLGDRVAVKVIRPELVNGQDVRARFATEINHMRMVYGTRVTRFEGAGLDEDRPWLAVEYVPGLNLMEHMELRGPMGLHDAAMLGAALADGLARIHEAGLVHRDLKPRNILLGPDGPKMIDFGLAMLTDGENHLDESGLLVGTIAYMAPEQGFSDGEVSTATDIYALGATLVFAFSTHHPYPTERGLKLLNRITDPYDPIDLSAVPDEVVFLIGAMLAYEPSDRPSLDAVVRRLLSVATADGRSIEQARAEFLAHTYVEPRRPAEPPRPAAGDEPFDHDRTILARFAS
jgi:serine/threonine protein kinase